MAEHDIIDPVIRENEAQAVLLFGRGIQATERRSPDIREMASLLGLATSRVRRAFNTLESDGRIRRGRAVASYGPAQAGARAVDWIYELRGRE